jgi:hypothetical protein
MRQLLDVDTRRASAMSHPNGEHWYARRLSDTGNTADPFPQVFELRVQEVSPDERDVPEIRPS